MSTRLVHFKAGVSNLVTRLHQIHVCGLCGAPSTKTKKTYVTERDRTSVFTSQSWAVLYYLGG